MAAATQAEARSAPAPAAAAGGATDARFPAHDITAQFSFPKQEEAVIDYWRSINAFQTSLEQSKGKPPFSFYDGPPFATGLPHYGHLNAGTIKDIVTRHAHATGHHVERKFGWDCHGLPVEHEIDKNLGITSKDDVMKMGIAKYNAECRAIVMRYQNEWRKTVERMGRWIDFDNGYKTMNTPFMESVWWVFKTMFDKNLVYRGLRVMPYSSGCTTPLSNFEAGLDYRDVQDPAVTVSFPLLDDPETSLLAWTTTPWTLPSNLGLCVHPDFTYIKIHDEERNQNFIILEKLLTTLYKDPKKAKFKKISTIKGSDMAGWNAPPCPLDDASRFTSDVPEYQGQFIKDADKNIIKDLKAAGRLIVQSQLMHSYPFCWRSKQPLIYKAIPAWFVRVEPVVDQLVKNNQETHWVPGAVREGRFGSWLANARDWNVSRNRYWGTPMPLWVSDDYEEVVCIGSIEELERLSGEKNITDLHREYIDHITIPSQQGKGVLRRVEEVFDCWLESGSMPYAQAHYPFENKEEFERSFPANFISEGIDQTRGWFYTLLIVGTHLFGKAPWKNVICSGLVQAADGKKMSKSLRNYPDPTILIDKFGADAIRLYLVTSPAVRAEQLRFREEGVKDMITQVFLPWLNSFRFFLGQVALLKKETGIDFVYDPKMERSENVMDRWILARCQNLIRFVKEEMDAYRLYTVAPVLLKMVDELTNWYIRFNRRRLKGEGGQEDWLTALNCLFETLFTLCRTTSSFTPFLTENIYQGLRPFLPAQDASDKNDYRSLHFLSFPSVREDYIDEVILRRFSALQSVTELVRTLRERNVLALRVPLKELVVFHSDQESLDDVQSLSTYITEELNVRDLVLSTDEKRCGVGFKISADWPTLGRKLRKDLGKVRAGLEKVSSDDAKAYLETGKITVSGVELGEGDLRVRRVVDTEDMPGKILSNTDGQFVVLLDGEVRPELQAEGTAREMVNRIQRLRKAAGLQATDEIDAFYGFEAGLGEELGKILESQGDVFLRVLKRRPMPLSERPEGAKIVMEAEQEIGDDKFMLSLVWA
ncbi:unnamed protein product [Tilletia laevis]|uniref:Isoleucine--tRNA ligase, cytoplasmic n=2 Tax=Tilletia TaxID=13289 RepID=A0A9N8Q9V0_9BASI|nr:unnamed protein product [Tilletia laevis]CAD6916705.1 unnamed protein product [Tilletia laevis]